ncbi:MAG: AAA domain-containing protein [Methylobacterium sp.]
MDSRSIAHAAYWRNTLADAQLGRGALSQKDASGFASLTTADLVRGKLPERLTTHLFEKKPQKVSSVAVMLRPFVYRPTHEHGLTRANRPDIITPVMTPATVGRDGTIQLAGDTRMAQDLLEPIDRAAFTLGHIDAFDDYLAQHTASRSAAAASGNAVPKTDWAAYLESCTAMMEAVCAAGWSDGVYKLSGDALLEPSLGGGAATHLFPLYDDMQANAPKAPLFETYAGDHSPPVEPCLAQASLFGQRLAHSSPNYSLAPAQRSALSHTLAAGHGEIVAVNGPPGTGKTTLLLSVVATLWSDAALRQTEPPIIVAASTNNQAVTNIIDAFGSDFAVGTGPLAGRWLPRLESFGAFYPSEGRKKELGGRYHTDDFFQEIETRDALEQAEGAYLTAARHAFPDLVKPDVPTIVAALHGRLVQEAGRLSEIEAAWQARDEARAEASRLLGDVPGETIARLRRDRDERKREHDDLATLMTTWSRHLASESLAAVLLGWLPPVAMQRARRARLTLSSAWPSHLPEIVWKTVGQVEPALAERRNVARQALDEHQGSVERAEAACRALEAAERRCEAAVAGLETSPAGAMSLTDCDQFADRTIRFEMFRLATHYWEGRWLIDMRKIVADGPIGAPGTLPDLDRQWRRRLKLTPCVVSTFYMLPRHFCVRGKQGGRWGNRYLYDHIDLLIVDEAGQVTPEVAGASFALAKRALIIGDTLQIEPIWSINRHIDIGNLVQKELLPADQPDSGYKAFQSAGKASANGSVMHIAQRASRFHQEPALSRGLMLLEHRRCFDEIVGYCNTLCYHGKLEPLRGSKRQAKPGKGRDGLPAMGYLHVDGICLTNRNGSRHNPTEAETIARWLKAHRAGLERDYGTTLDRIVGIVTPFGAQRTAILDACAALGIKAGGRDGELTVGTVHALQGAQRPVVLFSPVYSKHADGTFIDRSPSMLNVAVSRAMNSFLVFGDMDVMVAAAPTTPRGKLAAVLQGDEANALVFEPVERRDLTRAGARLQQLQDAREHDAFLARMFDEATGNLLIVTPWIKLERIHEIGALEAMGRAVARGVAIEVYADRRLNLNDERLGPERSREMVCGVRDALAGIGVALILVEQIHSKIVIADDRTYCIGSFNWFSAQRVGQHVRAETSLVYEGDELAEEIQTTKANLKTLADRAATRMRV